VQSASNLILDVLSSTEHGWPEYVAESFPLLLTLLNTETHEYSAPVQVNLVGELTVGNLRHAAEKAFGLPGRCRLVALLHDTALVLNDDAAPLAASGAAGLRLIAGDTIQVEPCDTPTVGGPEASLVVRLWEVCPTRVGLSALMQLE
jgi:hypothetical protein